VHPKCRGGVGATEGVIGGRVAGKVASSVGGGTVVGIGDIVVAVLAGAALPVGATTVDGEREAVGVVGDPQAEATTSVSSTAG
jgi:hypothetical protein